MSPRRPDKSAPVIVKRPSDERKKLPPELEAFARSQDEKLRVRRPRSDQGRVNDPREGYVIAGVSNRDARAVYDARASAMRALWSDGQPGEAALAELGWLLHDAKRLTLWRARRITGFDAFAEQVVGIGAERAQALVDAHTAHSGEPDAAVNERTVAAWLRTEAGLYEGDPGARVRLSSPEGAKLLVSVSLSGASAAFAGAGARHAPLAREAAEVLARRDSQAAPRRDSVPSAAEPAVPSAQRGGADAALKAGEDAAQTPPAGISPAAETPEPVGAPAGGARLLTRSRSREDGEDETSVSGSSSRFDAAPVREREDKRSRFGQKHAAGEAAPRRAFAAREERGHDSRDGGDARERGSREAARGGVGGERRGFAQDGRRAEQSGGFGMKRSFGRTDEGRAGGGFVGRGFGPKRRVGDADDTATPSARRFSGQRVEARGSAREQNQEGASKGGRERGFGGGGGRQAGFDQRGAGKQGGFVQHGAGKQGGFVQRGAGKQGGFVQRGAGKQGGFVQRGAGKQGGHDQRSGGKQGGFGKKHEARGQGGGFEKRGFDRNAPRAAAFAPGARGFSKQKGSKARDAGAAKAQREVRGAAAKGKQREPSDTDD